MSFYSRLCIKQIGTQVRTRPNLLQNVLLNPSKAWGGITTIKTTATNSMEDHDERNMKLGRPQSPHLSIYAVQLTSMMSISHRMTGMALGGYMMIFGCSALFMNDFESVAQTIESWNISPFVLNTTKLVLFAFPFSYHFCNGIRHLCWDFGKFLTIKEVYTTGYITLAASAVLTGVLMCL